MTVLCTIEVAWVMSLGVTTAVVDSTTVDPWDVTTDDSVVTMTDASLPLDGAAVEEGTADEVADADVEAGSEVDDTPVDRLTCRFSSFASAASISLAGTVDAEMIAKRRMVDNDHDCILKIVGEGTDLVVGEKVLKIQKCYQIVD